MLSEAIERGVGDEGRQGVDRSAPVKDAAAELPDVPDHSRACRAGERVEGGQQSGVAAGPGPIGQPGGVAGIAAAAGQAHFDVDQDLTDAGGRDRVDRLGRVDRHRDPGAVLLAEGGQPAQAPGIDDLIGQQEVGAESGGGEAFHLPDRRGAEGVVTRGGQPPGQRGRLERLDVRAQRPAGPARPHCRHVGRKRGVIDDERRGGEVAEEHERRP